MIAPCRLLFPFVGDSIGGSHVSTLELIRGLDRGRFHPVVAIHQEGVLAEVLREQGIEPVMAPALPHAGYGEALSREIATIAAAAPRLARFIRKHRIDLVHANDTKTNVFWGPAAKLAGARMLWHQRRKHRTSRRFIVYPRIADALVTNSEFTRSRMPDSLARRAHVVINPIRATEPCRNTDKYRAEIAAAGRRRTAEKIVTFVANLNPQKRVETFIEMAALLETRFPDRIVFPIFGADRAITANDLEARIASFDLRPGCVPMGAEFPIEPWLCASDIFVAPAVDESFGRTLVEAMLCGAPVVAADSGGHREIIRHGETGLLVPPDDPQAFAEAVAQLIGSPNFAKRLADAAMEDARRRFSVEAHVAHIQEIYDTILR